MVFDRTKTLSPCFIRINEVLYFFDGGLRLVGCKKMLRRRKMKFGRSETPPAGAGGVSGSKLKMIEPSRLPLHLQTGVWSFMRLNKKSALVKTGELFTDRHLSCHLSFT